MQNYKATGLTNRYYIDKCTFCGGGYNCHYAYSICTENAGLDMYGIRENRPDLASKLTTFRIVRCDKQLELVSA